MSWKEFRQIRGDLKVPYERPVTFHRDFYIGCGASMVVVALSLILLFLLIEYLPLP